MSRRRKRKYRTVVLKKAFLLACTGVIAVFSLLYFILPQRSTSGSEELAAFPHLSLSAYLNGDFQTGFEQAMKDQFALRDFAVHTTESIKAFEKDTFNTADNLLKGAPASKGLVPFGRVYRMDGTDWLTNMSYVYREADAEGYRKKAGQINELASRHPEARFYVYYCSRAEDMNWFDETDSIKSYSYPALLDELLDDDIAFAKAEFSDLYDFSHRMYRTDHHWNNYGAWRGYIDIHTMLSRDFDLGKPRQVTGEKTFGGLTWQGSRYRECGVNIDAGSRDTFKVYSYELPPHRTFFGNAETGLGLAADYDAGNIITDPVFDQYLNYYGFESKDISLDYGTETGHNLLILGDSFARAVREQLASHFDRTVFLNFRILDSYDLDRVMKEYNIDAVLLMGQQDAWSGYFLY